MVGITAAAVETAAAGSAGPGPIIGSSARPVRYLGARSGTAVAHERARRRHPVPTTGHPPTAGLQGAVQHMGYGSFAFQVVYLIHLSCVIVGFGSSFVYPVLAVKARKLSIRDSYAINHAALEV